VWRHALFIATCLVTCFVLKFGQVCSGVFFLSCSSRAAREMQTAARSPGDAHLLDVLGIVLLHQA